MRLLPMPIAFLFSALLFACFRDDGIVRPGDPVPVLARFTSRGVSLSTSDTSAAFLAPGLKKISTEMSNPQVALIWQFVGPKEFIRAPGAGTVNSRSPFNFTMEVRDPPSPEVLDNVDVSIGQFWLYNDADSNGVLDRLIHPDMVPINAAIDSLYQIYQKDMRDLIASGEVLAEPRLWIDTLLIGKFGTVTVRNGSHEDTLFSGLNPGFARIGPLNAIGTRFRVLTRQDRWQRFFSLRKRDNDYYTVTIPAPPGYASAVAMTYHRLIFPKPGQERAFEAGCRRLIQSHNTYLFTTQDYLIAAEKAGYQDYPYNGDALKKDFVLARSRAHFVIYLRDRAALDLLLAAERTSSFDVRRLDRLTTGYNLIECGDQYRCEVVDRETPVRLDMGMTNEFFNPPASKVELPAKVSPTGSPPAPAVLPAAALPRYAGTYDGLPYGLVHVALRGGDLWADLPEDGLFRLAPVDSMAFLVAPRHVQVQFVPDDSGRIAKLFIVKNGSRYVASRTETVPEGLPARIEALLAPRAATLDGSLIAHFEGLRLDHGGDTLRIRHAGGDSLWITVPGMYPQRADALDSSTLVSRSAEIRVSLVSDAQGCPGAWVEQRAARSFAPAYGCAAQPASERFPGLPDTLSDTVAAEGGSARDTDPTLDGRPRFAGDGDSLFLRGGDGWVAALGTSHPGGYALARGGDHLILRIPALEAGAVKVILHLRPERGSGRRRARVSVRAGSAAERQAEDLGGQVWVDFPDKPAELVLGPFPARKEPWYLRVERVPTADAPVAFGLAGYVATTD